MKIKSWDMLTREEQNLFLTLLWQDGYTEQAIADFLRTTKGRIVRRRQTSLKLPTEGRPKPKAVVDPERFADLLDLKDMENLEDAGVSSIAPPDPHKTESVSIEVEPEVREVREEEPAIEAPVEASVPAAPKEPTPHTCRWPLATWSKLRPVLCGKPVVPGHVVCEEHLALALRTTTTLPPSE